MERFTVPKICQQLLLISFTFESDSNCWIQNCKIKQHCSIPSPICWTPEGQERPAEVGGGRDRVVHLLLAKTLSVCAVRGQARVLLGRLDVMGPGAAAAAMRRNNALLMERRWAQQWRADCLSNLLGKTLLRRGHFKID